MLRCGVFGVVGVDGFYSKAWSLKHKVDQTQIDATDQIQNEVDNWIKHKIQPGGDGLVYRTYERAQKAIGSPKFKNLKIRTKKSSDKNFTERRAMFYLKNYFEFRDSQPNTQSKRIILDRDPSFTSMRTVIFLDALSRKYKRGVVFLPPKSPDLSPLDYSCWSQWDRALGVSMDFHLQGYNKYERLDKDMVVKFVEGNPLHIFDKNDDRWGQRDTIRQNQYIKEVIKQLPNRWQLLYLANGYHFGG